MRPLRGPSCAADFVPRPRLAFSVVMHLVPLMQRHPLALQAALVMILRMIMGCVLNSYNRAYLPELVVIDWANGLLSAMMGVTFWTMLLIMLTPVLVMFSGIPGLRGVIKGLDWEKANLPQKLNYAVRCNMMFAPMTTGVAITKLHSCLTLPNLPFRIILDVTLFAGKFLLVLKLIMWITIVWRRIMAAVPVAPSRSRLPILLALVLPIAELDMTAADRYALHLKTVGRAAYASIRRAKT